MEEGIHISLPYRFSSEIVRFETDDPLEGRPEPETPSRRFLSLDPAVSKDAPPRVTGVRVRAVAPNPRRLHGQVVEVTWDMPAEADPPHHFELHRSTSAGSIPTDGALRAHTAIPRFIDFDLTHDTTYYYQVIAVSADGKRGAPSVEQAVRTGKI